MKSRGSHNRSRADLQPLLEYKRWQRFEGALDRAAETIKNTGETPGQHIHSRRREALGKTQQAAINSEGVSAGQHAFARADKRVAAIN